MKGNIRRESFSYCGEYCYCNCQCHCHCHHHCHRHCHCHCHCRYHCNCWCHSHFHYYFKVIAPELHSKVLVSKIRKHWPRMHHRRRTWPRFFVGTSLIPLWSGICLVIRCLTFFTYSVVHQMQVPNLCSPSIQCGPVLLLSTLGPWETSCVTNQPEPPIKTCWIQPGKKWVRISVLNPDFSRFG